MNFSTPAFFIQIKYYITEILYILLRCMFIQYFLSDKKKNLQKATNVWFTRCPYKDNFKNHIPKMNT